MRWLFQSRWGVRHWAATHELHHQGSPHAGRHGAGHGLSVQGQMSSSLHHSLLFSLPYWFSLSVIVVQCSGIACSVSICWSVSLLLVQSLFLSYFSSVPQCYLFRVSTSFIVSLLFTLSHSHVHSLSCSVSPSCHWFPVFSLCLFHHMKYTIKNHPMWDVTVLAIVCQRSASCQNVLGHKK